MNKGFKALPEYVQRKIDPEMAKKYMGGGAVMDRPLFRQAGGPAQPNMQEMAAMGQQYLMQPSRPAGPSQVDPQQAAMVQEKEQHYAEDGAKIGQTYASEMMNTIDAADDAKSLIDALRGNEKPIEERRSELANYVGEADANNTPESVLAMVQPTIMMTEEGAIDSGIGELMQQLVAGVNVAEDEAMGQGVGELMAMGAGNTPPQNFSQGGPVMVRRFADGTPPQGNAAVPATPVNAAPSLEDLYSQRQAMYSNILGSQAERDARLQEQQRMSKAQMLFDIAQAGLAFAGETQGRTAAERLANAASKTQLFDRLGSRAQQVQDAKTAADAEKRSMQLAALQSAERSFETAQERALKEAMQAEEIAATAQLQLDRFKHETGMQESRLTHAETLQDKQAELQKALIPLRGLEDRKSAQVRAAIEEQLAFIKADLAITNDLERMEAQNFYDIEKMDKGFEQNKALASYNATLTRIRDDGQRAFTATQNALNRALQRELQVDSQEFESELRKELKQMDLDDNAIDRQVAKVQNDILNAFRKDEALRADQSLALQELIAQNDEDWRAQQQILDQYVATTARMKETRLADEASTTSVQYQLEDGTIEVVYAGSPEEKDLMNTPGAKRISITGSDYDLLTDVDVMNKYAAGETDPETTAKIQAAIVEAGQPKPGSNVTPDLPNLVMESEQRRATLGLPTQISVPDISAEEQAMLASNLPFEQIGGKAFGTRAFFGNLINKGAGIFMLGAPASEVQDAIKQVERLNENAKVAFRDMTAGRSQEAVNQFANILPKTTAFTESPSAAAAAVQATVDFYKQQLDLAQADLKTIGSFSERQKAENAIEQSKAMIQSYESLLTGINRFLKTDGRPSLSEF